MKPLKKLLLHKATPLTTPQMKHIFGGSGIGDNPSYGGSGGSGTCGFTAWTGDSWVDGCNMSYAEVQNALAHWNTQYKYWCCDHCAGTVYCGNGSSGGAIYG